MKDESKKKEIIDFTGKIASLGRDLIDEVIKVVKGQQKEINVNLFSPEKDEVINGLFFRIGRNQSSAPPKLLKILGYAFWYPELGVLWPS